MKRRQPASRSKADSEAIGLAGEYAVASELCRRGLYAQLTLGNHKKTDLLVEAGERLFRVSVKAKTGSQWPKVKGIWAPGDLIVFVDFRGKVEDERPDFYVLGVNQWKTVVKSIANSPRGDKSKINKENTLYWEPWDGHPKVWEGCAINVRDIVAYRDAWSNASPG